MKKTILVLVTLLFSTFMFSQERPKCLMMVDSKIKSLDKAITKLEELSKDSNSYNFDITLSRNQSKPKALRKSLENCKKRNSDYNYTSITAKVDDVDHRFLALTKEITATNDAKDKVLERKSQLQNYIGFVDNFPSNFLSSEDKENYEFTDTQNILELAEKSGGVLGLLKDKYEKVKQTIKSSEYQNHAYEKIDFVYAESDPLTSMETLNEYLENFRYVREVAFPNNTEIIQLENYLEKLVSKKQAVQNSTLSNILVSDFHGKNLNKILFTSNLSLNPERATASDFKTEFKAGEPIKAIAYLDNTFYEIYGRVNRPSYKLVSTINSGQIVQEGFTNSKGTKPYVELYIVQDGASYKATEGDYPGTAIAMEHLAKFSPRKHQVEVVLDSNTGNAQGKAEERDVRGSFTFDAFDDNGLDKMKANVAAVNDKSIASVGLPKAGMLNAGYEAKLVTLFKSIGWEETFTKAIISSSSFGYKKNYLDQVVGRTLQVYMVSKRADGGCMFQDFTVIQDKVGSNWGTFKRLSTGSQYDVSCSEL